MNSGIASLEQAYHILFLVFLVILAILFFACLIRAVIGPRMADRIVAVNMMGTMVIVAIAILAVMVQEGYLVDICLIYAMVSFLAVNVLSKVYIGVYAENYQRKIHQAGKSNQKGEENNDGNF